MREKPSPKPTPERVEIFAQAIVAGHNQSDAYRKMNVRSLKWKDVTVHNRACVWAKVSDVSVRVNELRQEYAEDCKITTQKKKDALWHFVDKAKSGTESGSVAVQAIKELNLMDGDHAPTKSEVTDTTKKDVFQYLPVDQQKEVIGLMMDEGIDSNEAIKRITGG